MSIFGFGKKKHSNPIVNDVADEYDDDIYEEDDEDSEERLSVSDAALIWASNGKDEDYMFGYSEEELEDAL